MKVDLLGLKINNESKADILNEIIKRLKNKQKTFIVTPYSEFFYKIYRDYEFKNILNSADFSIPDGISVLWLSHYFYTPLTLNNYYLKILQAFWQIFTTGLDAIFDKKKITKIFREKISGSDFFWDLTKLASENSFSIFLLGGYFDTPKIVADKLKQKFPNLKIAGISNSNPSDPELINNINNSHCDILMVAFGPEKQEKWIYNNLQNLNIGLAIGLGGTFDYVSGKKKSPPKFIRSSGFEWLYRLITQPSRIIRIYEATFKFLVGAARYKVFNSMPFRNNVAGVIINSENKILLACRSEKKKASDMNPGAEHWQLPQGGVEKGESLEDAVLREMHEEFGTDKFEIIGKCQNTYEYTWNLPKEKFFSWKYPERTKGQKQTIFYLKFTGKDEDIKPDDHEFSDFVWLTPKEVENKIFQTRLPMFELAMEEFNKFVIKK